MGTKSRQVKDLKVTLITICVATSLSIINIDNSFAVDKKVITKAGRVNATVSNTILSGKGAPSASIGIDGDFYLDKTSFNFYGPKTNGKWTIPASLRGPVGPQGPAGIDGKDGAKGSTTSASATVGPKGDVGPAGPQGLQGLQGLPGAPGSTGPAGATGPAGSSGGGTPGPAGATGAAGTNGTNGAQGLKGETGTAGATGSAGATGPSEVKVLNILGPGAASPWIVSTSSSGESTSSQFGNFNNSKSYHFAISVVGSSAASFSGCKMGSRVFISGGSALSGYSSYFGLGNIATTPSASTNIFNFYHEGTIAAGANISNLTVSVIDGDGCTGTVMSGNPVTITATAYIQTVGAIL